MSRKNQSFLIVLLIVITITFGGWLANSSSVAQPDVYLSLKKNLSLFTNIYKEITNRYVDEIDPEEFIKAGINGMTQKLDPYTSYVEKEESDNLQVLTRGKYGGVGMLISKRGDFPTCVEPPYNGTPAEKAGIREGDQIIEVEGKTTKDESISQVADRLKGKKGTPVKIKIKRAGEAKPLEFRLIRDIIIVQDIRYAGIVQDDVGYIHLTRFSKNSASQLRNSIKDLKMQGMKNLIFDLRSNPGGLLDAAVDVADLLVDKGDMIVYTKGRGPGSNRKFYSNNDPVLEDLKLVVLVNGVSASASEIVAGAVQDLDRGLIIGTRTFGKGLVQTLVPFSQTTGLRITTAKYYVPSGRLIQNLSRLNRDEKVFLSEDKELSTDSTKNGNGKEFKTKSGRIVYGGGGIKPDIEIELPTLSWFEVNLIRKSAFFNFAVNYATQLKGKEASIKITDEILAEFKNYLNEKDFKFQMEGEEEIKRLKKISEKNKFGTTFSQNLENLSNSIEQRKKEEFNIHLDFIKRRLHQELAAKLYGAKGEVDAALDDDPILQTALEVVVNPEEYAMKLGK